MKIVLITYWNNILKKNWNISSKMIFIIEFWPCLLIQLRNVFGYQTRTSVNTSEIIADYRSSNNKQGGGYGWISSQPGRGSQRVVSL